MFLFLVGAGCGAGAAGEPAPLALREQVATSSSARPVTSASDVVVASTMPIDVSTVSTVPTLPLPDEPVNLAAVAGYVPPTPDLAVLLDELAEARNGIDPVAATGMRIGDVVRSDEPPPPWLSASEGLIVDKMPAWIGVGDDSRDPVVIVGYSPKEAFAIPGFPALIFDESGRSPIGCLRPEGPQFGSDAVEVCRA